MKKIFGILALLSLAACGTGPSESDMNAAVKRSVEDSNKQMAAMGNMFGGAARGMADAMKADVPEVKKIGCKEDGEKAYRCDIEVIAKQGRNVTSARFVKASDGWMVTK